MAFLTLNNVTIPTAKGGEVSSVEIGKRDRSHNGSLFLQRIGIKRRWRYTTTPLRDQQARALIGLIQGEGHRWQFGPLASGDLPLDPENGSAQTTYLYSDTGLGPSANATYAVESNTAADGDPVKFLTSAPATYMSPGKFDSCFWSGRAVTNLVSANQRDCENTPVSDFNTVAGTPTPTTETGDYWQGTKSLGIAWTGTGHGMETDNISVSSGRGYNASFYVKGDAGGESFICRIQEKVGGGSGTSKIVTCVANQWTRVDVTHVMGGSVTFASIQMLSNDSSGKVYVDGLSLTSPISSTVSYPMGWVDGSRATYTNAAIYPAYFATLRSFSISFWTPGFYTTQESTNGYVIAFGDTSAGIKNRVSIFQQSSDGTFRFLIWNKSGSSYNNISTTTFTTPKTTNRHICTTFDHETSTAKLYVDGSEEDSDVVPVGIDLSGVDSAKLGNEFAASASNATDGFFSDLMVVPYAMDASMVSDISGQTVASPQLPLIGAAGDSIGDEVVNVLGRVSRSRFVGTAQSGTWKSNDRVITFELEEA